MKQKYNKSLTAAERRRVSDAIYRLKKEGFIIPEQELKKIKDASSYKDIYEQAVNLKGAVYKPIVGSSRTEREVSAKIAYRVIPLIKKYKRQREKLIKAGYDEDLFPKYQPELIGPSAFQIITEKMTEADIKKATRKRWLYIEKTLLNEKYGPLGIVEQNARISKNNMLRTLRQTVYPYNKELYKEIRQKIKSMNAAEWKNLYDLVGSYVFDSMYGYGADSLLMASGVNTGTTVLEVFLEALGIDDVKEKLNNYKAEVKSRRK